EDFEQAMGRIGAIVPLLVDQGLLPGQLTWNFAQGRLHYVVRSDRTALGLYCKPDAETNSSAVAEFIAGFRERA
ncbi:MAG TPA: hypothetical protein VNT26_20600, partial [Candidatus Sulfotelmatobacter sp.]|nr:hypothetical protein [Candidatus Sulfotelmatobacter sp.]